MSPSPSKLFKRLCCLYIVHHPTPFPTHHLHNFNNSPTYINHIFVCIPLHMWATNIVREDRQSDHNSLTLYITPLRTHPRQNCAGEPVPAQVWQAEERRSCLPLHSSPCLCTRDVERWNHTVSNFGRLDLTASNAAQLARLGEKLTHLFFYCRLTILCHRSWSSKVVTTLPPKADPSLQSWPAHSTPP